MAGHSNLEWTNATWNPLVGCAKYSDGCKNCYAMPNIVMGVTIEDDKYRDRLNDLKAVSAHMKYLSLEPLLGRIEWLDLTGIDWVIAGGESGPNARPMDTDWVREIRDWTLAQGKAFWFKQYSEYGCYGNVPEPVLDEKKYKQFPEFKSGTPALF
ncbi:MAG: phage Gp37/Gp68 family protein [Rickettsiales bacterium]|jgi:protein gp37|nr:phage Gp37/Gp68 family protein [Rickettsiales bacterium]